jgi:hypothetical protein
MAMIVRGSICTALLIVGACSSKSAAPDKGSTSATAPAAKAPDACSLLTDAEAGAALGGTAHHIDKGSKDAYATNSNDVKITEALCNYELVTSNQLGHDIYVAVYANAERSFFDQTGTKTDNPVIAGLGDAAKGLSNHVYVFSKGTMIQIYGSLGSETGLQDIARIAIAKL